MAAHTQHEATPNSMRAASQKRSAAPSKNVMGTYARLDVVFERGDGCWLHAEDGRRFLDFGSGIATNSVGHAHPHLVSALTEQAGKLWHTSNLYRIGPQEQLAERLCSWTFADRVFFTNSGAEACEGLIKLARRFQFVSGHPERNRIITFEGAFHGRTLGTIAAAGNPKYLEGFGPDLPGFDFVPFGDHDALTTAIGPETAAIMIEPVQGEGGLSVVPTQCLEGLRALCDAHGLLLLYDEVQSGVGRTGKLFAHQWAGTAAEPDAMAIAKGIGGGFPIGAFLATEEAAAGMVPGTHGSTYGGNPLGTACGNAVLDIVADEAFLEAVTQKALRFRQHLAELQDIFPDLIDGLRGKGLLTGIKLKVPNADVGRACFEQELLTVAAGDNVLRLIPPLTITDEEISDGVNRLRAALTEVRKAETSAA